MHEYYSCACRLAYPPLCIYRTFLFSMYTGRWLSWAKRLSSKCQARTGFGVRVNVGFCRRKWAAFLTTCPDFDSSGAPPKLQQLLHPLISQKHLQINFERTPTRIIPSGSTYSSACTIERMTYPKHGLCFMEGGTHYLCNSPRLKRVLAIKWLKSPQTLTSRTSTIFIADLRVIARHRKTVFFLSHV